MPADGPGTAPTASAEESGTARTTPADVPGTARTTPADGHGSARPTRRPANLAPDPPAQAGPEPVDGLAVPAADPRAERAIEDGAEESPGADLARLAWLLTVVVCLVTATILLLQGYFGYAGVTLAVALSAAINLF